LCSRAVGCFFATDFASAFDAGVPIVTAAAGSGSGDAAIVPADEA
jgi:hypothetical protein